MIWVGPGNLALLTDLYELTMAASYHSQGLNGTATFDLFVRELPAERNFLVACGIEDAIDLVEELTFEPEGIDYLSSLGMFDRGFLDYLAGFRFSGDVWGVAEGDIVWAREPLVRVTAPLIEAQVLETLLINQIGFPTMIASKAARVALACQGRSFVDFSLRRDHGADAGLKAARASFVGGASATSNVLAGYAYGIPISGTMAHSYVLAFDSEQDAFRSFAMDFPERATLLIDTFDTDEGARCAAKVATELAEQGVVVRGVRIDSGDLAEQAKSVRAILDGAGLPGIEIFVSGDLDESAVAAIVAAGAPVDGFGVGTRMGTSSDVPYLSAVYKLVAFEGRPRMKLSAGKVGWPGKKQVYRRESDGRWDHDLIALEREEAEGRPLLIKLLEAGRRVRPREPLDAARSRCARAVGTLPARLRSLDERGDPDIRVSWELEEMGRSLDARRGHP